MATATGTVTSIDSGVATHHRRRISERWQSALILTPSLIAVLIFVYGFIGLSAWVSLSNWKSPRMVLSLQDPLFGSYSRLFGDRRFQTDLRNTLILTVLFLFFAVGAGLTLAILLDRNIFGRSVFRNVFLFPYALSFITTGVAWRWIFNPETGVNLLFQKTGFNSALDAAGIGPLKPGWLT